MSPDLLILIGSSDLQGGILSCFLLYSRLPPGSLRCWNFRTCRLRWERGRTMTGALRGQPRRHLCQLVTLNWSDTQWARGESWTWEKKELIASTTSVLIFTGRFGVFCSSHKTLSLTVQYQDVLESLGVFKWISPPQQEKPRLWRNLDSNVIPTLIQTFLQPAWND